MDADNEPQESVVNEPQNPAASEEPGSRPGLKTLIVTLVIILLFVGIRFSEPLMGLLNHGR